MRLCEHTEITPAIAATTFRLEKAFAGLTRAQIGAAHGCSAAAVALAWVIRHGNVIAIPESGVTAHVKENAAALSLTLNPEELQNLDAAYPGPFSAN